ncbi:MAG: GDP-mannose 4,6-dehydratase [Gemmatimonadota bacterium]|jgi:GDP-4-dehydro-6-deoxy-D-mannose reductase|nr:hypothetical protein [Gemmatimonadota bacterium]MDP6460432.1 GDP-mannose 4,6-dehydratase [Gemmatimonadota bacterium]MDP6528120.1 GDP-mannose 4,6-dehydratase [Gemmatimonadota bacterium]MDP6803665.1 GDP-mannose 4,6-dehydratase [Gemmatimonadota bacterium]MDP7031719.1 GDP-mannose 4,6-dehydratase [Gemmatimonadota bacterium]
MRVLILGATGFVGRHLLTECASHGDALGGTFCPGEPIPAREGVSWHLMDLLDSDSIRDALSAFRPEGIVHLAGQANVALAAKDPVGSFRVNAEGTVRVLEGVREVCPGVRVVAVTSAEVYGEVPAADLPVTEARPPVPRSAYGLSKAAADLAAAQAAAGWGLDVVRMRPFNHVGPGQRRGFVAPDFASQVAGIERAEAPPVLRVGNLSARRDFTDVRDIVKAYRVALERGASGSVYNLCSGRSVPVEQIVQLLMEAASVPITMETDPARFRPVDVPEFLGDPTRARDDLSWEAVIPLEQSISDVLEEWRALPSGASDSEAGS